MHRKVKGAVALAFLLLLPATQVLADTETIQSVMAPALVPLEDQAIPVNLIPSLRNAKDDRPKPYADRCHTQQDLTKSDHACVYGDLSSKTTVVLFGDSHALSWFPAIERLAIAKKWKLVSLTMSSCWPADISAWNSTKNVLMPNCAVWRKSTLIDIQAMKPYMIFVSGTRGFSTVDSSNNVLAGSSRTTVWEAGMVKTITNLKKASSNVVMIGDTPISNVEVPACLSAHPKSIAACATPFKKSVSLDWLAEEKHVADSTNIMWIDPTPWICSTDPCSPLSGRYLIFVDKGHLTASFAWSLERPLWASLSPVLAVQK